MSSQEEQRDKDQEEPEVLLFLIYSQEQQVELQVRLLGQLFKRLMRLILQEGLTVKKPLMP